MKKLLFVIVIVVVLTVLGIASKNASATTGGPRYVSRLGYDSAAKTLYYVVNDMGGRGCPPVIHKLNLPSGMRGTVASCDELEAGKTVDIEAFFKNLKPISSFGLKQNKIAVTVAVVAEHGGEDGIQTTDFRATASQDGKTKAVIDFRGCSKDQPHIIGGYAIPDSTSMALLISRIGDCFEGGYVYEDVYPINDIMYYDGNRSYGDKTNGPLEPNIGNLVVYASNATSATPTPAPAKSEQSNSTLYTIIALVVGLGIGYAMRRLKSPQP